MNIDLLYVNDCPFWQTALANLQAALQAEKLTANIRLLKIESEAEAASLKFPGSPSFRVNGEDWWQIKREHYLLNCRKYTTPQGVHDVPTIDMWRETFQGLRAQAIAFVQRYANQFDEITVQDDQYDSYSVTYNSDTFWLVNFSPRENAVYSQTPITLEAALDYLQELGFTYAF